MGQKFEPEVYNKVKATIEQIREGAIYQLPNAIGVVQEQAEKAGLPILIDNCKSCSEVGVPAFTKATDELLELFEEYCKNARAFFDTFGIDY